MKPRPAWFMMLAATAVGLTASRGAAQAERPLSPGERVLRQHHVIQSDDLPSTSADSPPIGTAPAIESPDDSSPVQGLLGDRPALLRRPGDDSAIGRCADPPDGIYHRGQWSATYLTGFVGINLGPMNTPFSMVPELFRINCVWNSPRPQRILKGSWEGIWELDTLPVVDGPASIVIGSSLLLRYNIGTHKNRRFVPYFQMGGGGMYTDAYLHGSPVLSSGFEFIVQAGIGAHFFLNRRWALTGEWNYYHFSNGGMVLPNVSVNTMGGVVGLTYFFGRR